MDIMIPVWVDNQLIPMEKLKAHQLGVKHKAVSVFLTNGGKILLQQRALGKYHTPGMWANSCCTHPHWQEDSMACAQRRLQEELGIIQDTLTYVKTAEYRADVGGGLIEHEVVDIYWGEMPDPEAYALNPDEVNAIAWHSLDDIRALIAQQPQQFTPWLKIYLDQHADFLADLA
ncbi:isopentenyl-diphosphate Delta-isomerase [Amylibacter marinus]|nr:isopentenyl-diphosphate Delta-isomerase [Amylibacter marinus]